MDENILKVLQSIEKLIKGASTLSQNRSTFSSKAKLSQQARADKEQAKTFKAIAASGKDTNDALLGLNKNLVNLNTAVGKTTTGFGALNAQMAKFMSSLQPGATVTPQPATTPNAEPPMSMMGRMKAMMSKVFAPLTGRGKMPNTGQQAASIVSNINAGVSRGLAPVPRAVTAAMTPLGPAVANAVKGLAGVALEGLTLEKTMEAIVAIGEKLTSDFIMLARVGLGSSSNLFSMSVAALKAGMSLKEYTQLVHDNIAVASRQSSMDNFDKLISAADSQLSAMGIFGAEARGLQASLAESSTMMGTSQKDLQGTIAGQINTFDELRKTTNIAADEFAKLVENLSMNSQVQSELLGVSGQERIARQQELLQIATTGQRLGLTAQASQQLADALIAQRKATVKDRIEQGGAIRQLAAFLGQGGNGDRIAELNTKGRRRSADEDEELRQRLGSLDQASQQAYQNGSLGAQNVLDNLDESIGKGGLGEIIKANRPAQLAQESGPAGANKDFGQHVGEFGQFVGQLLTWGRGLKESIAAPIAAAVGGILLTVFSGPVIKMLTGAAGKLGLLGGAGGMLAEAAGGAGAAAAGTAETAGVVEGTAVAAKSLWSTLTGIPKAIAGYTNAIKFVATADGPLAALSGVFGDVVGAIKNGASLVIGGFRAFVGSFGPALALVNGVIEAITGEISDALNPSGGFFNRVGGVITAALSALPNLIIDAIGFVFGDSWGQFFRNGFDQFVALANASVKTLLSDLLGAIAKPFEWLLPKDSHLAKMIRGWSDGLEASADENFATFDKLSNDNSTSLKSISAENQKTAEKATQATTAATKKMQVAQAQFSDVQDATSVTASSIMGDAAAIKAMPQVQVPTSIAPAPVNTPAAPAGQTTGQTPTTGTETQLTAPSELTVAMNAMLAVMQQMLEAGKRQADNSEALVRLARAGTTFDSSEATAYRLLNQTRNA